MMIVDENDSGKRLDQVLAKHPDCAHLGTRARKRICDEGLVLVHGIPRNAVYKVKARQEISISDLPENRNDDFDLVTLKENDNFIAFYKPVGIATERLLGSSSHSLDEYIQKVYPHVVLLNRLDTETSGIIVAAKSETAKEMWKEEQDSGKIIKKYYALVEGKFSYTNDLSEICINKEIDLSKTKVKALEKANYDKTRHTLVKPVESTKQSDLRKKFLPQDLASISDDYARLLSGELGEIVDCSIFKGVRHQIRAHLASIGLPLIGDSVYGNGFMEECFFLHHYKLESDLFRVEII